jgi:outer membrane scaffolding protein for murein synthesis (MipA/OmpV family)
LGTSLGFCAVLYLATISTAFPADPDISPRTSGSVSAPGTSIDSGWFATLKATGGFLPSWEGAKSYSFLGYPSIELRRADAREWSAPDDGLDFSVYDARGFSIGPVVRYELGRYRSDDPRRLFGIQDVPWTIEPGVFAEFRAVPNMFRARLEVRHGLGSGNGFVADAAADYLLHFGPATFALGPRLGLGDQEYMRKQFGVTLTESLQNGAVAPFKPDGGLKSAGVATSVTYDFSKQWQAVVYGGYDRLVADAAKSPLVRKLGSPDQLQLGLTLNYSFSLSGL